MEISKYITEGEKDISRFEQGKILPDLSEKVAYSQTVHSFSYLLRVELIV